MGIDHILIKFLRKPLYFWVEGVTCKNLAIFVKADSSIQPIHRKVELCCAQKKLVGSCHSLLCLSVHLNRPRKTRHLDHLLDSKCFAIQHESRFCPDDRSTQQHTEKKKILHAKHINNSTLY